MRIYSLCSGPLRVNTYFLVNEETKNAIIIDGGENYKLIKKTESELGIKIIAVLLTHAHFDHAGNAKKLQDDGAEIYISKKDAPKLLNDENLSADFGRSFDSFVADKLVYDGQEIEIDGIKIKVMETPGHTDGSLTFIVDRNMFTGDTLFLGCVGRTDFKTGNREDIISSVERLLSMPGDYNVYPGHDEFTTLEHERKYNDFRDY